MDTLRPVCSVPIHPVGMTSNEPTPRRQSSTSCGSCSGQPVPAARLSTTTSSCPAPPSTGHETPCLNGVSYSTAAPSSNPSTNSPDVYQSHSPIPFQPPMGTPVIIPTHWGAPLGPPVWESLTTDPARGREKFCDSFERWS